MVKTRWNVVKIRWDRAASSTRFCKTKRRRPIERDTVVFPRDNPDIFLAPSPPGGIPRQLLWGSVFCSSHVTETSLDPLKTTQRVDDDEKRDPTRTKQL